MLKHASESGAWQRSEGKNPEGGLNAKGRASLKAQGHDIKPGVKGPADTPEKQRRKGSFLSRMFGPGAPGSMKQDNGEPSRRALSAKAWGEPVPQDDAGRARLYAKGQALLKKYENTKESEMRYEKVASAAMSDTLHRFGLHKLADAAGASQKVEKAIDPLVQHLRNAYMRQGAISGGLRGAILGGAGGYLTSGEEDDALKRTLMGAGIGGVAGAGLGAAHGRYLTRGETLGDIKRRILGTYVDPTRAGVVLQRPGRLMAEEPVTIYSPKDPMHAGFVAGGKAHPNVAYGHEDPSPFAKEILDILHPGALK
jgi:Domain of unknown function (DUF6321)